MKPKNRIPLPRTGWQLWKREGSLYIAHQDDREEMEAQGFAFVEPLDLAPYLQDERTRAEPLFHAARERANATVLINPRYL